MPQLNDVVLDQVALLFILFFCANYLITLLDLCDDDGINYIKILLI